MPLPPRVSPGQAEEIAAAHYGVSAVAERLAAEHDDTFRLVTADGTTRLLKIAPADAGASAMVASFQTAVLLHLAEAAPSLPVQRVIGTLGGRPELRLDGRVVRMTSYLEGPTLGSRPASAALRRHIGGTLARLNRALRPFTHPDADRTHLWDLQNFHRLRPLAGPVAANDLALRIARHHTNGTGVIVTANAYHGVTSAVADVSPSLGVALGPRVRAVPAPPDPASVAAAIDDLERHGERFAAFLADSLLSSDGVLPDPAGFLKPVQDVVRAAGGLYIADEVQSGFGRTGGQLWGYQRHGLDPDIVVMGKPMGNGMPIAGIVVRREVLADFGRTVRYFNTFGGNPVCVAAAAAVLDVLEEEELPANAAVTGGYLKTELARVAASSPLLAEVRGAGLYLGADVVDPATGAPSGARAAAIVNGMRDRRVLISATGPLGHTLKIRPPLPFSRPNADQLLEVLADTLTDPA